MYARESTALNGFIFKNRETGTIKSTCQNLIFLRVHKAPIGCALKIEAVVKSVICYYFQMCY